MNWWLIPLGFLLFQSGKWYGRSFLVGIWVEVCPRSANTKGRASCRGDRLVSTDPDTTCTQTHYWVHGSQIIHEPVK